MIIDQYALTPMQLGMLFHHATAEHSGVDIEQLVIEYEETPDIAILEQAWQATLEQHPVLRTSFRWEALPEPIQQVHDGFRIRIERHEAWDESSFSAFMAADRRRGFDLKQVPLMRLTFFGSAAGPSRLVWTLHHILMDGRAFIIVLREVFQRYDALCRGEALSLPDPHPFRDYVEWIGSRDLSGAGEFWKEKLKGFAVPTPLLVDRSADPNREDRYGEAELRLPLEVSDRLRAFARSEAFTLNTLIQGAWALLLSRYSGEEDIVFGATKTTRRSSVPGAESIVGLFLATLPVRSRVVLDRRVRDWLAELRAEWVSLREYEHTPLVAIRAASEIAGGAPLFDTLVVFENQRFDTALRAEIGELPRREFQLREQTNFALTLAAYGDPEILLKLEYDSRRFGEPAIQRMLGHLRAALESMAAHPEGRVADVPLVTEAERQQLLYGWNDLKAAYPRHLCLHEWFEAQVERTPDNVALVFENQRLTYRELNARANQLANFLRGLGVGPETLVGLRTERSLETVVGLIGILKAGGAYLPIDTAYPKDRVGFMLEDAQVRVLLTQAPLLASLAESQARVVCLDTEWGAIARESTDNFSGGAGPDSLAYVIYTSGSTGKPKGCLVTHYNVVRLMQATDDWYRFHEGDVWTLFHSHAFDFSVWEIWGALLYGGRLVVVPYWVSRSPDLFHQLLREQRVTVLNQTPSAFRQLIQADETAGDADLALRLVIFGGEALELESLRPWFDRHGDARPQLVNMYGITETTVHVTYRPLSFEDVREGRGSVIGGPIPDLSLFILDSRLQPAPVGVAGEICVGGAGVARGYLNRPELTRERFIDDPFSTESGARLYRSGDLARRLANGDIEYLGRIDQQVKIRGFRVELGEIETSLAQHPGVKECVVTALADPAGDKRLVAYMVASPEARPDAAGLRQYLKKKLPDYMVPSAFVLLDRMPLTDNGKIDRKALPAPGPDRLDRPDTYVAPRTPIEELLSVIWCEVLHVDRIGIHDNFFELGGHSLLAMRLIERMRREGLHADVRALFVAPTLAELAAVVGREDGRVEVPPNLIPFQCDAITPEMLPLVELSATEIERIVGSVPDGAANVQDIYPLAPLQEGLLFHHLMDTEGDPYLLAMLYSFDSRARLEGYLGAFQAVIDRHDILRTAVVWEGLREPVQVVWRKAPMPVEEVQFDPADGDVAKQLLMRFDPRHHRIDLRQAPLVHACITHDAANERWLLLLLRHHLVTDHTTLDVMQEEIQAHLLGQANRLPAPPPFRNFVAQARLGVSQEEHEEFFRRMLGDVDEPTAPFGLLDVQGNASEIEEARLEVDAGLARRLRERANKLGVSATSLHHLAWAQVLARVSGREDVVFGTVLFGRMHGGEGADRVLGLFINTLPARIRVGKEGVEASVRATHTQLANLLRHEHASLALAQRCSAVPPPAPLFTALLNYRHSPSMAQAPSAEAMQAWEGIQEVYFEERTNYPLMLSVDDRGEGFTLTAQVSALIGPMRVCEFMHKALEGLVEALETAPATAIGSIDVLPESERQRLLIDWNRTELEYPREVPLAALVEAQAARTPDNMAVVFGEQSLTYRELNERANQLARELVKHGAGPDQLVGIFVERSLYMLIALLAVAKSGAGYLPMDTHLPPARLLHMIDDSGLRVVVTETDLQSELPQFQGGIVTLDNHEWRANSRENLNIAVTPECLAYVIYTSGSTGKPKGVQVSYQSLVNLLWSVRDWLQFSASDRLLAVTTISFDIAGADIWLPWLVGATTILASREAAADGAQLRTLIERHDITFMQATPVTWWLLLGAGWCGKPDLQIVCTGEAMPRELAARLAPMVKQLWNLYGPTETTIWSTGFLVEHGDEPVLIGRPVANTQCYILNEQRQPVPIGCVGELYIAGDGLARGYLNRPELTAEKFVPDPFGERTGARMYRTGDLARYLPDGNIECLGRTDHQVKMRGFRIELGEIETALKRHPGIRQAVVVAREDTPAEKRLVAYFVPSGAPAPERAELSSFLKRQLPEYMVPSDYVALESLPISPNGKIDRKALPAPTRGEDASSSSDTYVAPRTETERTLVEIFSEVLGTRQVGIDDDFFDLGGHSLTAMRAISLIKSKLNAELPVRVLFRAKTVSQIAAYIAERDAGRAEQSSDEWSTCIPIQPGGSKVPLFCVARPNVNALGYLFLSRQLGPDQPVYGLQRQMLEDPQVDFTPEQIRATAEEYIRVMRSIQPRGPYFLVGNCQGAYIAFEMTRQLESQGERISMLGMLDVWPEENTRYKTLFFANLYARKLLRLLRRKVATAATSQTPPPDVKLAEGDVSAPAVAGGSGNPQWRIYWPGPGFKPVVVSSRIVVFHVASQAFYRKRDKAMGWRNRTSGGVEVEEIPGGHITFLREPFVKVLAEKLNRQMLVSLKGS